MSGLVFFAHYQNMKYKFKEMAFIFDQYDEIGRMKNSINESMISSTKIWELLLLFIVNSLIFFNTSRLFNVYRTWLKKRAYEGHVWGGSVGGCIIITFALKMRKVMF